MPIRPGYPHLSYSQIEQVWIQAGGSKALAPLMAAIALAESAGYAGNTNLTDNGGTQTSWGLWQISDGTHGWSYGGDPYDPVNNAKAAIGKLKSQGLGAWGTYTSGLYKKYLQGDAPPSTGPIPTGSGGGAGFGSGSGTGHNYPVFPVVGLGSPPGSNAPIPVGADPGAGFNSGFPIPDNPFTDFFNIKDFISGIFTGSGGLSDIVSKPISTLTDGVALIGKSFSAVAEVFSTLLWLMNPANELRVLSGVVGLVVLGIAIYFIATV